MDQRHIILGCKGAQPGMWDLATQQQTFAARAPTATRMDPVESPWTTAIASVPQQVRLPGNASLPPPPPLPPPMLHLMQPPLCW